MMLPPDRDVSINFGKAVYNRTLGRMKVSVYRRDVQTVLGFGARFSRDPVRQDQI